ncbi:hypothetical protein JCGZ_20888 [Jatropha curcas]|uniref:NB-ARC domain-containing protein n=1 Tax=Jatropha curcas TaxID=180498 RepID=A0A067L9G8_JATCU|nr:hypothetical protein JCGZ_20888 [Jatropha curcas]
MVNNLLMDKKCLIVVDDSNAMELWRVMGTAFRDISNGTRIIFVVRSLSEAPPITETNSAYRLHLQSNDESWALFTHALKIKIPPELEQNLKKHILRKCGGLPKVIVKLAELLSHREATLEEWSTALDQLNQDEEPWSTVLEEINKYLPLYLRRCLFYFGLFPVGYKVPARRLMALWVAEGLGRQKNDDNSPEDAAEACLRELISYNMVQVTERKPNGKVKTCSLPEALRVHWFANAKEANFLRGHNENTCAIRRVADHLDQKDPIFEHIHVISLGNACCIVIEEAVIEGYNVSLEPVIEEASIVLGQSCKAAANSIVPDAVVLHDAAYFFSIFKRLFADLILSFQDIESSHSFFQHEHMTWEKTFKVIEFELGFMYDLLYTKASVMHTYLGSFPRTISLSLTIQWVEAQLQEYADDSERLMFPPEIVIEVMYDVEDLIEELEIRSYQRRNREAFIRYIMGFVHLPKHFFYVLALIDLTDSYRFYKKLGVIKHNFSAIFSLILRGGIWHNNFSPYDLKLGTTMFSPVISKFEALVTKRQLRPAVRNQARRLRDEFKSLKVFLEDSESKGIIGEKGMAWMEQLSHVCGSAEKVAGLFLIKYEKGHSRNLFWSPRNFISQRQPWDIHFQSLSGNVELSDIYLVGKLKNQDLISNFPQSLTEVTLSASGLIEDPMQTLEKLPNLRILRLFSKSFSGKKMLCKDGGFPKLEVLKLWELELLEEWNMEKGAMPSLKHLEIRHCINLKMLPDALRCIDTLREVKLTKLPMLSSTLKDKQNEDLNKIAHVCLICIED